MKKSISIISIITIFAIVICSMALCFVGCNKTNTEQQAKSKVEPVFAVSVLQEAGIFLSSGEVAEAGEASDGMTQTLTATVKPDDAPDKRVDWTVEWGAGASRGSENVSNYLTVTPNSDGSNVATVTCLQGFEGDGIIITVRTRVGNYSASCFVTYVGRPSSMTVNMSGYSTSTNNGWNKAIYALDSHNTYTFPIVMDNAIHQVGSNFHDYSISVTSYGSITATKTTGDPGSSTPTSTETVTENYVTENIADWRVFLTVQGVQSSGNGKCLAYISIEDGSLKVKLGDPTSAFSYSYGARTGWLKEEFAAYPNGKIPYFEITVTENNSGLSQKICILAKSSVSSVTLNMTNLSF